MTDFRNNNDNAHFDIEKFWAAAESKSPLQAPSGSKLDEIVRQVRANTGTRRRDESQADFNSVGECREKSEGECARKKSKTFEVPRCTELSGSATSASDGRATVSSLPGAGNRWIDAPQHLRVLTYQIILDEGGETYRFTLNLSHPIVAKARRTKKTLSTWANERLTHALKPLENKIGAKLLFWYTIEVSDSGVTHLHGAIGIHEEHLPELRRALRRVSGVRSTVAGAEQFFVHVTPFNPTKQFGGLCGSLGWVNYSLKDIERTANLPNIGSPIVCRRLLNQRARAIWPAIRTGHWLRVLPNVEGDDRSLAA